MYVRGMVSVKVSVKIVVACLLLTHAAAFAGLVVAQSYPVKPIRMVVAFPPGGGSDVIGRMVAKGMQDALGQRVIVENVVGVQDSFHRYIDADMVYFQFCGSSKVEPEFGVYDMEPADVLLVPGGIAHRKRPVVDPAHRSVGAHEEIATMQIPMEHAVQQGSLHECDQSGPQDRIGVDTGAFATGCLTCVVLEGDGMEFIQTEAWRD